MYRLYKPLSEEIFEFATLEEAEEKIIPLKEQVLLEQADRFTIVKAIVDDENNETWVKADLENDVEHNKFYVFNTLTGHHEMFNSLTTALARHNEIKLEFINSLSFYIKDAYQPVVNGAENL
jgi:hypothetical protein